MNIEWAGAILKALAATGVRELVFCAGARNSPLVAVLEHTHGVAAYAFFEERCGAFFALGAARREGRPVAIVTTSGTAAAELLPAAIEAFHSGVPLILVTADRPRRLRGTGAPQTIHQAGLFTTFVERQFDLEHGAICSFDGWSRRAPIHINICFDEPLLDEPIAPLELRPDHPPSFAGTSPFESSVAPPQAAQRIAGFLQQADRPLAIVGTLETDAERDAVIALLTRFNIPAYLEGPSGIREDPRLRDLSLRSGERILNWALQHQLVDRVLRIGGIPTARVWRDLEQPDCSAHVLSLSNLVFPGLSRGDMICAAVAPTCRHIVSIGAENDRRAAPDALMRKDRDASARLDALLSAEPRSEPALVHALSKTLNPAGLIYAGNSMPIRELDLAATRDVQTPRPIHGNRGTNGIDGQISTFIGLARARQENCCIVGDLTALYDLAAPWALAYRNGAAIRLVVINNGGGKIFSRVLGSPVYENRHTLNFESWARMWQLDYQRWTDLPARPARSPSPGEADIVELVPDTAATARFWADYDNLWTD